MKISSCHFSITVRFLANEYRSRRRPMKMKELTSHPTCKTLSYLRRHLSQKSRPLTDSTLPRLSDHFCSRTTRRHRSALSPFPTRWGRVARPASSAASAAICRPPPRRAATSAATIVGLCRRLCPRPSAYARQQQQVALTTFFPPHI